MMMMGLLGLVRPLLAVGAIRRVVERQIDARVTGPSAAVRATARMHIWGRVTHQDGRSVEGTAETPEGYRFTAMSSVECAIRVLSAAPSPGYHTPSTAFSSRLLDQLPECTTHA